MDDLKGKVAVVTGGAGGIGRALAVRFAAEGMRLVVADVEEAALDATVAALKEDGAEAIGVATDVTSSASVEALAEAAYAAYGAVLPLPPSAATLFGWACGGGRRTSRSSSGAVSRPTRSACSSTSSSATASPRRSSPAGSRPSI